MDSVKQKTFRSKSFGPQKASVRRKSSFNKVRLQFENISRSESNKSVNKPIDQLIATKNKSSKDICVKTKYDFINGSLEVIKEKDRKVSSIQSNCSTLEAQVSYVSDSDIPENFNKNSSKTSHLLQNSLATIERTRAQSLSDLCLVKKKINFFEEKTCNKKFESKKCDSHKDVPKENKLFVAYNSANYGNRDTKVLFIEETVNQDYSKDNQTKDESNEAAKQCIEIESKNNSAEEKTNELENIDCDSSLTLISTSDSMTSDLVTFDNESEVVLRRPQLKIIENLKTQPIPRQRTSLGRKSIKNKSFAQKELKISDEKRIITDDNQVISKTSETTDALKVDVKRSSSISQDSGISDVFLNNSFLYQSNKTVDNNSDDKNSRIVESDEYQRQLDENNEDNEQIYEHIYEELSNFRSLSPNEWIDIENNEEKQRIHIEVILNRRSHSHRPNHNYRKSYKPKPTKRKSRKISVFKASDDSASATEYEDIDEEDIESIASINIDSTDVKNQLSDDCPQPPDKPREQCLSHIYEMMSDSEDIHHKNDGQEYDLKTKLVRELSNKIMDQNNEKNEDSVDSSVEKVSTDCQPIANQNIYTSTPHRIPKFQSSLLSINEKNSDLINRFHKRDSIQSRNSSIYISPNYSQTNYNNSNRGMHSFSTESVLFSPLRTQLFQKQNSVTTSIASYLEFNTCAENGLSSFNSEPLYQFYQKDVRRRAELWIHFDQKTTDLDYDDYEINSIYESGPNSVRNAVDSQPAESDGQCLSADRIKTTLLKRNISAMDFVGNGPNRSLWCQLPQVIDSKDNLLRTLSDREKRLQESMFEIITSEASYCKSLNILVSHFNNCIELSENNPQILSQREKKCLFSNIVDISKVSSSLLSELEKRFEQNILLYDVCDILYDYAVNHFQPYIHYCAYQRDQEKLLTQLTQSRSAFVDVLQRLESYQICQNQNLLSFLMLPMQRITRYPLLIDAVCQQLPENSPIFESSRKALGIVNQLVRKCNEETKKVQRMQELIEIEKLLHFRSKMKSYPIVSGARYLVKRGSVLRLSPQLSARRTIGKSTLKWTKSSIHIFLFSDLLILAKKKSENNYSVFDYCSRNTVQLISLSNSGEGIGLIGSFRIAIPHSYANLAQLILLHNHESKSVEYTISFNLESEKLRWIEAVSQPSSDNPNEVIYEEWDCPQVQCIRSYSAQQTDEISLEETDVLNVCRKMKDGWFEGQRIRDGVKGWFPSEYTEEIVNQHVRARNMRLRHRLLMFTQSVIADQKQSPTDLQKK